MPVLVAALLAERTTMHFDHSLVISDRSIVHRPRADTLLEVSSYTSESLPHLEVWGLSLSRPFLSHSGQWMGR